MRLASRRRLRGLTITAVLILALGWLVSMYANSLHAHWFLDGWVLLGAVLFLTAFNLRKKLPMLPLGRATTWTRTHVYVGLLAVFAFLMHTDLRLPSGPVGWALWLLFVVVSLSGLVGLYLSATVPPKFEQGAEMILLERIPRFRAQLASEVEALAVRSVEEQTSLTLSNFYADTLHDYMSGPRDLMGHLRGSQRSLTRIRSEINKLKRYLDAKGLEIIEAIEERVTAKHNLDFQYAHRMLLRLWLFVHIPATYSLVILACFHLAQTYAFASGRP